VVAGRRRRKAEGRYGRHGQEKFKKKKGVASQADSLQVEQKKPPT
jgi:hypothetical protein